MLGCLLVYLVTFCRYSDASQCSSCGVYEQCFSLSLALSLSAQVCPGHMTANHSL